MAVLQALLLFLSALAGMEVVAWWTHKHVMHGPLWALHRSHHRPRDGRFEANDLFAVFFAAPSMALIALGTSAWPPGLWLGLGMTGYGVLYLLFHDGLVHRRFRLPIPARALRRQVQAHRLHHACAEKEGAVSFGFLWAPSARSLKAQFAQLRARRR